LVTDKVNSGLNKEGNTYVRQLGVKPQFYMAGSILIHVNSWRWTVWL